MKVKVLKTEKTGLVFNKTKVSEKDGKQYGYYLVEAITPSFTNGMMMASRRVALVSVEESVFNLVNYKEGDSINGKIIRIESTEEFDFSNEVINPETGEVVTRDGKILYRRDVFTTDMNSNDQLVFNSDIIANKVAENISLAK